MDSTKIISKSDVNGSSSFILKNGTKLSDVFKNLPSGIVYKHETGIGATTLELLSKRNSIIVEPLKITASSKAHMFKHALYVGSETNYHPKTTNESISRYLSDKAIPYKKIMVVADSLPRVIDLIGKSVFENFFLMVDEVDSFQNDSTFRDSMEKCLDIYKQFPQESRALVSATHIGYTDPSLQNEQKVSIKYINPTSREIFLIHTDNVEGTAIDKIQELLKSYPSDKVVVAFNYVNGCHELATQLVSDKICKSNEIKILCSQNSKGRVGDFYSPLDSDALPAKVNFLTSAYFTGVDINERYHLLSMSNIDIPVTALSDLKLKQIAGRCRPGLVSETIVYNTRKDRQEVVNYTVEDLVSAAESEIKSIDCFKSHFDRSPILNKSIFQIREYIVTSTQHLGHSLVRLDAAQVAKVSYFNIDASIEVQRINQLIYDEPESLRKLLEKDNRVYYSSITSTTKILLNTKPSNSENLILGERTLKVLSKLNDTEPASLISNSNTSHIQQTLIKEFEALRHYMEKNQLIGKLRDYLIEKEDIRGWNSFKQSAMFAALSDDHLLKRNVKHYFIQGQLYTSDEIRQRLEFALKDSHVPKKFKSDAAAIRFLHTLISTKRSRRKDIRGYIIGSLNPHGVVVINHIKDKKQIL